MLKKIFLLLITIFIWISSIACSLAAPAEKNKSVQEITVVLDWLVNPDHAPLFIADKLGFFKEEGLQVRLVPPPDPHNPLRLLILNQALLAIDYQPQYVLAVSQGLPFEQVGTLIQSPLNSIVVLKKSGIKKLKDLKNKKIGYAMAGVDTALIKAMLNEAKVNPEEVTLINIPFGLSQALLTQKVDAITGIMRQFELPKLKAAGFEATTFNPEDYGIPAYQELIFVALKNQAYDDRIQRFLKAVKKGIHYLNQYPEKSWDMFTRNYPDLNTSAIKETWLLTIPLFAKEPQQVDSSMQQKLNHYLKKYPLEK